MGNKKLTKNQHYVPRFYLKFFLNEYGRKNNEENSNGKLTVSSFDLRTGMSRDDVSISRICSHDWFYEEDAKLPDNYTEGVLSKYEEGWSIVFKEIIRLVDSKQYTEVERYIRENKYLILEFIHFQIFRGESGIKTLKQVADILYEDAKAGRARIVSPDEILDVGILDDGFIKQEQNLVTERFIERYERGKNIGATLLIDTVFGLGIYSRLHMEIKSINYLVGSNFWTSDVVLTKQVVDNGVYVYRFALCPTIQISVTIEEHKTIHTPIENRYTSVHREMARNFEMEMYRELVMPKSLSCIISSTPFTDKDIRFIKRVCKDTMDKYAVHRSRAERKVGRYKRKK